MTRFAEELLMAYADGELPPEELARVEQALEKDAEARRRVRLYRESAALARAAFESTLFEPVPRELEERVRKMARAAGPGPLRSGAGLRRRLLPLAASLALFLAALGGLWFLLAGEREAALLARVLEHTPSGVVGEGGILPTASYRTAEGGFCRRFERIERERAVAALACRRGEGDWSIRAWVELAGSRPRTYAPASAASADPLTDLIDRLGLVPLSPEEEARHLASGR